MAVRGHGAMHPGARERSLRRAHARAARTASEDLVRHAELSSRGVSFDTMSAGLARNWWAVGARAALAGAFIIAILLLPMPSLGALAFAFAAYVAADGVMALIAGTRAMRRGARWRLLMFEGAVNISVAGALLIWPAMAALAFLHLVGVWAIVTGALLLAAARRLLPAHGKWPLALAGVTSLAWGVLAAISASPATTAQGVGSWLIGYALPFGVALLVLSMLLQRRHWRSTMVPA